MYLMYLRGRIKGAADAVFVPEGGTFALGDTLVLSDTFYAPTHTVSYLWHGRECCMYAEYSTPSHAITITYNSRNVVAYTLQGLAADRATCSQASQFFREGEGGGGGGRSGTPVSTDRYYDLLKAHICSGFLPYDASTSVC